VKSAKGSLPRALDHPDPNLRFFLFHGADEAGSRALALRLLKGLGDAEKFVVLGSAVKADPASLADEAAAMALFGGKRALWIEPAGDEITHGVAALLDAPAAESVVIAIAPSLTKRSSLLQLADGHARALSHVSYVPEGRELERIILEQGRTVGLGMAPDVAQRIAAAANGNQAIAAGEVEKLALFLDASPDRPRDADHDAVDAVGAEAADADLMRAGDIALSGEGQALTALLARLPHGGGEPVSMVRAVQRRLLMLAPLRARVEQGERIEDVLTSMGKALFWKEKPLVRQLLSTWTAARIAEATERAAEAERQMMLSPAPSEAVLGEFLVTLARVGARRR
jgi:DNA polymerase-3 subunit delta